MILIALGSNLPSRYGPPRATLEAALAALDAAGIAVVKRSKWYETAPVPVSDQPWYVNGAVAVSTDYPPEELLDRLHRIEHDFGRERGELNAARSLDLDLLDYDGVVAGGWPILPHPRLGERAFVLYPLRDVAPDWRHPITGQSIDEMLALVDPAHTTRILE